MAKKSWWQKHFARDEHQEKIDIVKDLDAIVEYLEEINYDVKSILPELKKLMELEKERKVADSSITHINLETQASILDKLLEKYEFFQNDVDINGLRLKAIANQFLRNAKKHGLTDLVKEKKADQRWKFFW
ncbi:hypothetical protein HOA91_01290 [Candidatus Woesearchaeota archaeon]|jgi:hypothetical protein|nr:hypothetical protein [Candidatus Woesearchaeota archaeon]